MNPNIFAIDHVHCTSTEATFYCKQDAVLTLAYAHLVWAYIFVPIRDTILYPKITETTSQTKGQLMLVDDSQTCYALSPADRLLCAGKIFFQLLPHITHCYLGYDLWTQAQFSEDFPSMVLNAQLRQDFYA